MRRGGIMSLVSPNPAGNVLGGLPLVGGLLGGSQGGLPLVGGLLGGSQGGLPLVGGLLGGLQGTPAHPGIRTLQNIRTHRHIRTVRHIRTMRNIRTSLPSASLLDLLQGGSILGGVLK